MYCRTAQRLYTVYTATPASNTNSETSAQSVPLVAFGFLLDFDPSVNDLSVEELDPRQLCTL